MKQWKRVSGVVLSGILALSMTLGGMTAPDAGAKAKKAKLKTKKISVTVGKKKTIKIVKKKKSCKYLILQDLTYRCRLLAFNVAER